MPTSAMLIGSGTVVTNGELEPTSPVASKDTTPLDSVMVVNVEEDVVDT